MYYTTRTPSQPIRLLPQVPFHSPVATAKRRESITRVMQSEVKRPMDALNTLNAYTGQNA
jgi:hypothetical protein